VDFKRVEAPHYQPYPRQEATTRTLHALALTPAGEAPAPVAPQPNESADDLIERGRALRAQGKHADAMALFERATQLAPQSYWAWFQLGYTLDALQRYAEALSAYATAQRFNASEAALWNNKGSALNNLQRYPEALAATERAVTLDPNLAEAWTGKGMPKRSPPMSKPSNSIPTTPMPGLAKALPCMVSSGMKNLSPPTIRPSHSTLNMPLPGAIRPSRCGN
jgi:tetratricopeptide (TPR) repeat protein